MDFLLNWDIVDLTQNGISDSSVILVDWSFLFTSLDANACIEEGKLAPEMAGFTITASRYACT
jgi:hypothetical protein